MSNVRQLFPGSAHALRNSTTTETSPGLTKQLDPSGEPRRGSLDYPALQHLINRVGEVYEQANVANWDGNGAAPIALTTYQNALRFIARLPSGLPVPEVLPDVDGYIEIEWYQDRRSFSFLVSSSDVVFYAGYYGPNDRFSGRFTFEHNLPSEFRLRINVVYHAVSS